MYLKKVILTAQWRNELKGVAWEDQRCSFRSFKYTKAIAVRLERGGDI